MTREQAEEIVEHLLDAADAMRRAEGIIFELGANDKRPFVEALDTVSIALNYKLLWPIYKRYPDLRPEEPPDIRSTLRWDEVSLPPLVSVDKLDEIIFSVAAPRWLKMARIVGDALNRCNEIGLPVTAHILSARVRALADSGRLESQGDLRMWYQSEVRLKS